MMDALKASDPLFAIMAHGQLFLLYRPLEQDMAQCTPDNSGGPIGRSTIWLAPIELDDTLGSEIGGCWFAPIRFATHQSHLTGIGTLEELHKEVEHRCLLLPLVHQESDNTMFKNMYYAIANNWTERKKSGAFTSYALDGLFFSDWESGIM